ncbi:MAG: transporter substrate-binding domain-containing protein [Ruminococcaceae bacterium]|nr:transporter substrate-binding domain-containing protein [Oscillospiraceae bacterium]
MNRLSKAICIFLVTILLFSLTACSAGERHGRFRILKSYETKQLAIGFRNDDIVRYYVMAALQASAADGTVHNNALHWFGHDPVSIPADKEAMAKIKTVPKRTLIVGVDIDAFPMAYKERDQFRGFDVDLARDVCYRLGWKIEFIPIKAENAYVELSSGNIDVAWGGLALDIGSKQYTTVFPYMEQGLVLVVRDDNRFRSVRKLKGATLAMDSGQYFLDIINADEDLRDRLGAIQRMQGGARACFQSLDTAKVDCILVYKSALWHFAK